MSSIGRLNTYQVIAFGLTLLLAGTVFGANAGHADAWRVGTVLGLQHWSELGDIEPVPGDDFEDWGANFELSYHLRAQSLNSSALFWGANFGVFGHESDIRGFEENEELQASVVYLGPSIKWGFHDTARMRWFLDAGLAYYWISIDEYEDSCFFDCDIFEYYDDDGLGGFLGLSGDVTFGSNSGFAVTGAIKVHFVDFEPPLSLGSTGDLDGEIYQLQFGVAFGR